MVRATNKAGSVSRKASGAIDLRKLSRADLLDMLLDQSLEIERLTAENEELKVSLANVQTQIDKVASIEAREERADVLLARLDAVVSTLSGKLA